MVKTDIFSELIAKKLVAKILGRSSSSHHYSVFWQKHLETFDVELPLNWKGIGSGAFSPLTPRDLIVSIRAFIEIYLSAVLSRVRIPRKCHREVKVAQDLCRLSNRAFDYDVWRHSQVLRTLDSSEVLNVSTICVIGDGLATMVGLLYLRQSAPSQLIISVNLPEILLLDYRIMREIGIPSEHIQYCDSQSELENLSDCCRVVLIAADNANIIRSWNVDLFINIDSMQEMTQKARQEYFEIIASNNAYFYCCNMTKKTLRDGAVNTFLEYPWGLSNSILSGEPSWLRRFIRIRSPWGRFRAPVGIFKTPHLHRLVKF